jgi:hypothetical protein
MKKIITSAGLVVLGAASLQSVNAQDLASPNAAKPWSVSLALRGFYDSNYDTQPGANAKSSFGMEVTPSASYNFNNGGPTTAGVSAVYTLKYYADRVDNDADHSYQVNAHVDHNFNENYSAKVSDSFVVAQEAELVNEPGTAEATFLRANGNNIRNTVHSDFMAQLTPVIGLQFSYNNNFYDYANDNGVGSYAALLNRLEHLATLDLRYKVLPQTTALVGYQFGYVDYTSDEPLAVATSAKGVVSNLDPSSRDVYEHYIYGGVDHTFTTALTGSLRVGAEYADYFNDDSTSGAWNPYVDASLSWRYLPGSTITVGVHHALNQTDVAGTGLSTGAALSQANLVLNQESTLGYINLVHKITGDLTGTLMAQIQNSSYNGGSFDGFTDNYYMLGASLSYMIKPWIMAETGYTLDRLDSDIPGREFTRNRVYLGLRTVY